MKWQRTWVPLVGLAALFALNSPVMAQNSSEEQAVVSWYRHYLGRDPEPQGFIERVNQLREGASPLVVQAEIVGSDEFLMRAAQSNLGVWVDQVHRYVHGRPASQEERQYWIGQMFTGDYHERVQVSLGILQAARR
jgi:hypothetical protein